MDSTSCARCGKPQAEHFVRFAVVDTDVSKSSRTETQGIDKVEVTTKTTTETFKGIESVRVCEDCIQKQRAASARAWGLGSFLVVLVGGFIINFILIIMIFGEKQSYKNNYGLFALIALGIAFAAGIAIGLLFRSAQMDTETPFIAAKVYAKLPGICNYYHYLPLVPSVYTRAGQSMPDPVLFKGKNNMETELCDMIFRKYLLPVSENLDPGSQGGGPA